MFYSIGNYILMIYLLIAFYLNGVIEE